MPNSQLNLWALTAGATAEQRWKDVTLGKHQNNSDKAICNSRKREHPFHTNSIISPSASNWDRITHRADACLCSELLHLSEGSCIVSSYQCCEAFTSELFPSVAWNAGDLLIQHKEGAWLMFNRTRGSKGNFPHPLSFTEILILLRLLLRK